MSVKEKNKILKIIEGKLNQVVLETVIFEANNSLENGIFNLKTEVQIALASIKTRLRDFENLSKALWQKCIKNYCGNKKKASFLREWYATNSYILEKSLQFVDKVLAKYRVSVGATKDDLRETILCNLELEMESNDEVTQVDNNVMECLILLWADQNFLGIPQKDFVDVFHLLARGVLEYLIRMSSVFMEEFNKKATEFEPFKFEESDVPNFKDLDSRLISLGGGGLCLLQRKFEKELTQPTKRGKALLMLKIVKKIYLKPDEKGDNLPNDLKSRDKGFLYFLKPQFSKFLFFFDCLVKHHFNSLSRKDLTAIWPNVTENFELQQVLFKELRTLVPNDPLIEEFGRKLIKKMMNARFGDLVHSHFKDNENKSLGKGGAMLRDELFQLNTTKKSKKKYSNPKNKSNETLPCKVKPSKTKTKPLAIKKVTTKKRATKGLKTIEVCATLKKPALCDGKNCDNVPATPKSQSLPISPTVITPAVTNSGLGLSHSNKQLTNHGQLTPIKKKNTQPAIPRNLFSSRGKRSAKIPCAIPKKTARITSCDDKDCDNDQTLSKSQTLPISPSVISPAVTNSSLELSHLNKQLTSHSQLTPLKKKHTQLSSRRKRSAKIPCAIQKKKTARITSRDDKDCDNNETLTKSQTLPTLQTVISPVPSSRRAHTVSKAQLATHSEQPPRFMKLASPKLVFSSRAKRNTKPPKKLNL